jgi:hypothetical protein
MNISNIRKIIVICKQVEPYEKNGSQVFKLVKFILMKKERYPLSKLMSKVMFYVGKVQVGYYYIITRINFR